MYKRYVFIMAAVLLITAFSGCSHTEKTAEIKGPAYAEPITETMLQALNGGDYQSYILAFDANMIARNTQDTFQQYSAFVLQRIGLYKSKKVSDIKVEGALTTVTYTAKFSNEPADVQVGVVYEDSGDKVYVTDFWINSPKLWEH